MGWLRGDHQDWKIAVRFDFLQTFHHLESIHAGHLKIQQNQAVTVLTVQFAHRNVYASSDSAALQALVDVGINTLVFGQNSFVPNN